jgi:prepilin-type N-terminal cleavage/methylation domain-containing protein/prepilin-type processing-associated H-X9-DG protein
LTYQESYEFLAESLWFIALHFQIDIRDGEYNQPQPMKYTSKFSRARTSGFTLVELLVVILIIAALAALGLVGVKKMINHAHRSNIMNDMKQLVSIGNLFSLDNNGKIVSVTHTDLGYGRWSWAEHFLVQLNPDLVANNVYDSARGDRMARELGIFADEKLLKLNAASLASSGVDSWRTYAYSNEVGFFNSDIRQNTDRTVSYSHQIEAPHRLRMLTQREFNEPAKVFPPLNRVNALTFQPIVDFKTYSGKSPVGFYDGHVEFFAKRHFPTEQGINPSNDKPYTAAELNEFNVGRQIK